MQKFTVMPDQSGGRLDVFLTAQIPELSRSSIQKLLADGKVLVNDKARPTKYKVKADDIVTVYFDPKDLDEVPDIDLPILYEDDDCLVVDKPVGILTHSKGRFNPEATVATFIRSRVHGMDGERAGIVHRLDRGTSGVIICAKTPEALTWLQKQFSSRKVKKTYLAVISAAIEPTEAVIDVPIARNPRKPQTFHVSSDGRSAQTTYKVVQTAGVYNLLELYPQTGRTHQLRVHLEYLGRPIVGDTFYEGMPHPRMLLHAWRLEMTLPNRQRQVFEAPIPTEFTEVMR